MDEQRARGHEGGGAAHRPLRVGEVVEIHVASPLHRHGYSCTVLDIRGTLVHLSTPVQEGRLVLLPSGVGVTLLPMDGAPPYAGRVAGRRSGPDRRVIVEVVPPPSAGSRPRPEPLVVVSSGKGGVGKSVLSLSLGAALQRLGRRVVVIDANLGTPNLHVLLALTPRHTLQDVATGRCSAADALLPGPEGLRLLPGRARPDLGGGLDDPQLDLLIRSLAELSLEGGCFLVDTAAGIDRKVTQFAGQATYLVLVTTPDPTAVTDTFSLLKALADQSGPLPPAGIVVNMVGPRDDVDGILRKMGYASTRFLGVAVEPLGAIPFDPAVTRATREQRALFELGARRPAAGAVLSLAQRLVSRIDGGEG